jgi:hypothetical protein
MLRMVALSGSPSPEKSRRTTAGTTRAREKRRRLSAARRQARTRARGKNDIGYYRLEISHRAIEGLIQQWIATGQITDEQALRLDRAGIERELARGIEAQGQRWR